MERLAAADPLPGAEQLTLRGAARGRRAPCQPARHARARRERHPARRPRPRRWALAAVATAGVALAAFAAVNLLDSDAPGPNVVELAVAAVSADDAVYHTVERKRARAPEFGPDGDQTIYYESWRTTDGRQHQKWYAAGADARGKLVSEFAGPPDTRPQGRARNAHLGQPLEHDHSPTGSEARGVRAARRISTRSGIPARGCAHSRHRGGCGSRAAARSTAGAPTASSRATSRAAGALRSGSSTWSTPRPTCRSPLSSPPPQPRATGSGAPHPLPRLRAASARRAATRTLLDLDPHPDAKCARGADEIMGQGNARLPQPLRPLNEEGARPLVWPLREVEAAGTAPASAEHHPDACYERSRRSLISATGSVSPRDTSPAPHPRSCPVTAEGRTVAVSPLLEAACRVAGIPGATLSRPN